MDTIDTQHEQLSLDLGLPEVQAGFDAGGYPTEEAAADLGDWRPMPESADRYIIPDKPFVEGRIQDIVANDGYAAGAVQMHADAIVGTGLTLQMNVDYQALGQTEDWALEYNESVEAAFRSWANATSTQVDVRDMASWPTLQSQAYKGSFMQTGEILAVAEVRRSHRSKYRTKIRLIDTERLRDPDRHRYNVEDRNIIGGIEYNNAGVPIAYWIADRHPRALFPKNKRQDSLTWTRVPRFARNGRQIVFHIFDPMKVEQSRGYSMLTTIVRALKMLDKIQDTILQAALLQTVYAAVVKSNASYDTISEAMGHTNARESGEFKQRLQNYMQTRAQYYERNRVKLKGANTMFLLPEEELELTQASAANPDIGGFLNAMRTEVARGQNMSLEQLTGDYSQVNYSSGQLSGVATGRSHDGRRTRIMLPFVRWALELFLEEHFILEPTLMPPGAVFHEDRYALTRCGVQGPPTIDADPDKSAKAAEKRISNGTTSMAYECALLGLDWRETLRQQMRELTVKKEMGLMELQSENAAAALPPVPEEPETGGDSGDSGN